MTARGFFQKNTAEGIKTFRDCRFESTGVKNTYGKVIWRKIAKDGKPTNTFAEQFQPNMPYAFGKWFCRIDAGAVLRKHPELKVETEKSAAMSHEEYCNYLSSVFTA